jgi:hypothetical protein
MFTDTPKISQFSLDRLCLFDAEFQLPTDERIPVMIVVKGFELTMGWTDCTGFKTQAGFSDILYKEGVKPVCPEASVRACRAP